MDQSDLYHITPEYPSQVQLNATQYGNKAANLMFLEKIVDEFNSFSTNAARKKVSVPKFFTISHSEIVNHLRQYIQDFDAIWINFQNAQAGAINLTEDAKFILSHLREQIVQCFTMHPFLSEDILTGDEFFMVRSTGDEDKVLNANPGGNESFASHKSQLNQSIGMVIASYLSEKSLSQRLSLNENITEHFPLCPCLIQKLIQTDKLQADKLQKTVVGGVCYSDLTHDKTRINAALGHGDLIVNGLGPFDEFTIIRNRVYAEVREKPFRIEKKVNPSTGKMDSVFLPNSFITNSCLSEKSAKYIHSFAKFIEQQYGMKMDIEFVYDPNTEIYHIVQARALPRDRLTPSALSHDFIAQYRPKHSVMRVVTKNQNTAAIIEKGSELIIADTIEEAQDQFLKSFDKKNTKAIIVKQYTPSTSHGAGFFQSQHILVFQIKNANQTLESIRKEIAQAFTSGHLIVADVQHRKIFYVPSAYFNLTDSMTDNLIGSPEEPSLTVLTDIRQAQVQNLDRLQKILKKMNIIQNDKIQSVRMTITQLRSMLENLSVLPSQNKTLENIAVHQKILSDLVRFILQMYLKQIVSFSLTREIVEIAYEVHNLLVLITQHPDNPILRSQYLDIVNKLEGAFLGTPEPGMKIDSLMTALINKKRIKTAEKAEILQQQRIEKNNQFYKSINNYLLQPVALDWHPDAFNVQKFEHNQKIFFSLALDLQRYVFKAENKEKWTAFCYDCCYKNKGLKLVFLCNTLIKMQLQETVLNIIFPSIFQKHTSEELLSEMYQLIFQDKNLRGVIKDSDLILNKMQSQIGLWADPAHFDRLHQELKKEVNALTASFRIDREFTDIALTKNRIKNIVSIKKIGQLFDILDLSLKSLQCSNNYSDRREQALNFINMLEEFYFLLNIVIVDRSTKEYQLNTILSILQAYKMRITEFDQDAAHNLLLLSKDFSVIAATLYRAGDSLERVYVFNDLVTHNSSLADLHTLIHQTALDSLALRSNFYQQGLIDALPQDIINIMVTVQEHQNIFSNTRAKLSEPVLLLVDMSYPKILLKYNLPLRYHSGTLSIEYDVHSKYFEVTFHLYGNDSLRWQGLVRYGLILLENRLPPNIPLKAHQNDNGISLSLQSNELIAIQNALKIFTGLSYSTLIPVNWEPLFEKTPDLSVMRLNIEDRNYLLNLYKNAQISYRDLISQQTLTRIFLIKNSTLSNYITSIHPSFVKKYRTMLHAKESVFKLFVLNQDLPLSEALDIQETDINFFIESERAAILTSPLAHVVYKKYGGSFLRFLKLSQNCLNYIFSEEGLTHLFDSQFKKYLPAGYLNVLEFMYEFPFEDASTLQTLISEKAVNAYESGFVSIEQFIQINKMIGSYRFSNLISLLISDRAIRAYKEAVKYNIVLNPMALAKMRSEDLIELAISDDAFFYYQNGWITPEYFATYHSKPIEYFSLLLSHQMHPYYEMGITAEALTCVHIPALKRLIDNETSSNIRECHIDLERFLDFLSRNHPLQVTLLSAPAFKMYSLQIDYLDFDKMPVEKVTILLSEYGIKLCEKNPQKFKELYQINDMNFLSRLISDNQLSDYYQSGGDIEKIYLFHLIQNNKIFSDLDLKILDQPIFETAFENYLSNKIVHHPESARVMMANLQSVLHQYRGALISTDFYKQLQQKFFHHALQKDANLLNILIQDADTSKIYPKFSSPDDIRAIASCSVEHKRFIFLFNTCNIEALQPSAIEYFLNTPGLTPVLQINAVFEFCKYYKHNLTDQEIALISIWLSQAAEADISRYQHIQSANADHVLIQWCYSILKQQSEKDSQHNAHAHTPIQNLTHVAAYASPHKEESSKKDF
ncbi:MAG: hypothetical protein FJ161_00905 [Gammaproteobacteria bacterium]|nr:hypothetical protein [Gammaproteobacteria bacterium]